MSKICQITGKKAQYDIEKIAGFIIIFILLFSIFFQINQIISINSGYFEEEITENIEEKLMNAVNIEEKKLSEIKAEEIAKFVDPDDYPFIALHLQVNHKIWTSDKILVNGLTEKGYGNFFISTEELKTHLYKKKPKK